ncbi:TBP2 [Symbiodinium natans]|uniref:TBP2 protein n=1 Tax=Symbiodinium natans TaxID=878477 RepID=A0A812L178_9DINO|nr:TBP2 [Symbiodinium natans]
MSSVDDAIKAAIQSELQAVVTEKLSQQDERFNELKQAFEELSGRVEERGRETQQLREDVDRQKSDAEALDARVKSDLEAAIKEVKDRLDRHESDEEGLGGLTQLRSKVDGFAEELTKVLAKMEEHGRTVASSKTRTDSCEEALRDVARKCEDAASTVEKNQVTLQQVEEISMGVRERQQVVEDSVVKKYDSLWKDVLKAMEELKVNQEQLMMEDMKRRQQDARREGRSHVKYVTQLVATVHDERRKLALTKDLLTVWQQHTWTSVRRRTGIQWLCNSLASVAKRRQHQFLNRWVRHASIETLVRQLREEYAALIPDVQKAIKDSGLPDRCNSLEQIVEILRKDLNALSETVKEHSTSLEGNASWVEKTGIIIIKLTQRLDEVETKAADVLASSGGRLDEVEARVESCEKQVGDLSEAQKALALAKDVQSIMRDVLLIWNSIKHLDAAKADKKDMDTVALETSKRDRQSTRRIEDMQSQITDQLREETLRVQEKCAQLDVKVDESTRQFLHWEQMWERLAAYVEELVKQVGDMQDGRSNCPGCRPPSGRRPRPASATFPRESSERNLHESENGLMYVNSEARIRAPDVNPDAPPPIDTKTGRSPVLSRPRLRMFMDSTRPVLG